MHNLYRGIGISLLLFALFLAADSFGAFGSVPSSCNTPSCVTTTSTTSTSFTGTDSLTTTTVLILTSTVSCATTNFVGGAVITVSSTSTTFLCTYASSTSTTTTTTTTTVGYAVTLSLDRTALSVGQNVHFYGFVTTNGLPVSGLAVSLLTGTPVRLASTLAVTVTRVDGSFDFYQSFSQPGTYSTIYVKLPDGTASGFVIVTVSPAPPPVPTVTASSAILSLGQRTIYWSIAGFPSSSLVVLTSTNAATGTSSVVANALTSSAGAASGSFTATNAMAGNNNLVASFSSTVSASATFNVVPSYLGSTVPQSILGGSNTFGSGALGVTGELLASIPAAIIGVAILVVKGKDDE